MKPGSGCESGRDARRKVRVSVKASHGGLALTTQYAKEIKLVSFAFIGVVTFFLIFLYGMKTAEAAVFRRPLHVITDEPAKPSQEEVEAARGVEAMFIGQMVESMRKTVPENEYVEKSQAERIYENLLDYEYSRGMSEAGNFGIAELVLAEMKGKR